MQVGLGLRGAMLDHIFRDPEADPAVAFDDVNYKVGLFAGRVARLAFDDQDNVNVPLVEGAFYAVSAKAFVAESAGGHKWTPTRTGKRIMHR